MRGHKRMTPNLRYYYYHHHHHLFQTYPPNRIPIPSTSLSYKETNPKFALCTNIVLDFMESSHEILIIDEEDGDLGSMSSSSSDDESSSNSMDSSSPLYEMSSLVAHLPLKRGLSKHFDGKSQSFTSLSNVSCLDDLVKPERPCKKLKMCKSFGGGLDINKQVFPGHCSRSIGKKVSRGSFSSLGATRHGGVLGRKSPISPQNSGGQTLLFA